MTRDRFVRIKNELIMLNAILRSYKKGSRVTYSSKIQGGFNIDIDAFSLEFLRPAFEERRRRLNFIVKKYEKFF